MTWTSDAMLASYGNAMPDSYQADTGLAETQDAIRATADHWTRVMGVEVKIDFVRVGNHVEYYGPDNYMVSLMVGNYKYNSFVSLTELENFLERMRALGVTTEGND